MTHANIRLTHYFLFYPRPWLKPRQVQRRRYASNALLALVALDDRLEVRSHWLLHIRKYAQALHCHGIDAAIKLLPYLAEPYTPFEREYQISDQAFWLLSAELS
ncbi:hypothetical protein [Celerinatantimonas yamalensis]|uniref:Uncharacterized protein n=1 Tax=Celerinatantimonas yamalensis TaxID=559956 RepID=A0ABW9GBV6_9GAMM